jgi:hypothetical protein
MGRLSYKIACALAAVSVCLLASGAGAQEYCVSCTGPDALYRCVIDNAQPGGGQPLQMLCITTMAKQGGHATCAVKRGTVFQCDGAVKRIPWAALTAPQPAEPGHAPPSGTQPAARPETATAPAPPPGPASQPAESRHEPPPDTMLDLAKRANEDTAKQVRKAGETMKEATRKTWDCVASLFTRCW